MKTKRSTMIVVGLILSLIGIGVICLGVYFVSDFIEKKNTYISVAGVVVDYEITGGYDTDPYDDYYDKNIMYAPVVEYEVDGKIYTTVHKVSAGRPEYFIGQKVSLKYNPRNPEDVIFKFNNAFWIMFVVGTAFAGCGLPMTFVGIFKYKKQTNK